MVFKLPDVVAELDPARHSDEDVVGMDFGLGFAQEMFRGEIDPPAGHGVAVRRPRPPGDRGAVRPQER